MTKGLDAFGISKAAEQEICRQERARIVAEIRSIPYRPDLQLLEKLSPSRTGEACEAIANIIAANGETQ